MNRQDHDAASASTAVEWQEAGVLEDLAEGEPTLVRIGTKHVVAVRRGDRVTACEPLCPHKFAPLEEGHLEGDCLVCPVHEAHFHLATGDPREEDGWAGHLGIYETRVEGHRWAVRL